MRALIRIQPKYRPVSGDIQGFRIQACVPNLEARRMVKTSKGFRATDEAVPAFRKPYLISESMDYPTEVIGDADMERFKKNLAWEGFTEFEFLKKDDATPGAGLTPEMKAKIDAAVGW